MPFDQSGQDVDFDNMTDEEIKEVVKEQQEEQQEEEKVVSFNKAKEASILYEQLPDGFNA